MKDDEIAYLRLNNQNLTGEKNYSPREIAGWMGALQAQDYNMVKWAFGVRMQDPKKEIVDNAIDNSEIIRTHLLRPTWHFVSAEDFRWLHSLSAPRIKSTLKYRHDSLGLDNISLENSNKIISEALKGGKHLTRAELAALLKSEGISLDNNRSSHILLWAELSGIICSGRQAGKKPTYALISEVTGEAINKSREEYLGLLVRKYFSSHGPATLKDFAWWSGLSSSDIRTGISVAGDHLASFRTNSTEYLSGKNNDLPEVSHSVLLLPAYDEFIISYADRSAVLTSDNKAKTISVNGIFHPVVIINGKVAGLWKPSAKKETIIVDVFLFNPVARSLKAKIEETASGYGSFLGKKAEVKFNV